MNIPFALLAFWASLSLAVSPYTELHSPGFCALYGIGGKESFIDIPLPQNIEAQPLTAEERNELVGICGSSWQNSDTACCDMSQIQQLKTNLAKVRPLISSCPACQENFFQMFCHFTCSPDQSTFVNVTKISESTSGNDIVDELDFYIDSASFASEFFDSCKNIKFGATNGYAMDLIGGGAHNYSGFLKFLGDKKPMLGGSPFQMNFKYEDAKNKIVPFTTIARKCNDVDPRFRCSCADCPQACPILSKLNPSHRCTVGKLPCFSFAVILLYTAVAAAYIYIVAFAHGDSKNSLLNLFDRESALLTDDMGDDNNDAEETTELSSADEMSNFDSFKANKSYFFNDWLEKLFYQQGLYCAKYPWHVICVTLTIATIICSFIYKLQLERDPIHLWVSPEANAYKQKDIFDKSFGPFYRSEQLFVSNATGDSIFQDYEFVKWWFEKEVEIQTLQAENKNVTYSDICFKPTGESCALESFSQYFHGDINYLPESSWKQKISSCAASPVNCLPTFQQPLTRPLLFGGDFEKPVLDSPAFVVTLLLNNNEDQQSNQILEAKSWEEQLETYISGSLIPEAEAWGVNITYNTDGSVEKEINKSSNTDVKIIVISYLVMFAYVSIALGTRGGNIVPTGHKFGMDSVLSILTRTRFGLGLAGVFIVLLSVFSSVGVCSIFNLKSTLIIAEVIPFLVLAVGVDNIFLLCNELQDINYLNVTNDLQLCERVAKTLANVGPSILLSATSEVACFLLASAVGMPAVRNFAIYSALAIFFNTILQLTAFVAVLALDQKRLEEGRLDLLPFIQIREGLISLPEDSEAGNSAAHEANLSELLSGTSSASGDGWFGNLIKKHLAPWLFRPTVKKGVLIFFITWLGISLSLLPKIELGLDQRLAMPADSHLVGYFDDMYKYLNVGPPIYWVVDNNNVSSIDEQRHLCGKFTTCDSMSFVNILQQEYKREGLSTIAEPVAMYLVDGKQDFIDAYHDSIRITQEIKKEQPDLDVFAYSPFYIFFVQYENIISLSITLICIGLVLVFALASLLLGSFTNAAIIVLNVALIMINVGGSMALWNVSLNAVSLVNLMICLGLAVEFTVHLVRHFNFNFNSETEPKLSRKDGRAYNSLCFIGNTTLSGITMTKLIGISVLGFTRSKIFQVYYFRMWLSLIVISSIHSLLLVPILLGSFGSTRNYKTSSYAAVDNDEVLRRLRETN
ncbi:hypothetical protein FOA43_000504 [Brettanomyces nanus]|uniref:SSD domain-containing protein n=1 Tax=Eeniella nana TaxID=13502 RepID=A0A875RT62_EENNA|nr:uncharacterized protein FOA43_000504 [Brettanomyces nanus]QPG73197.1 hypothetical protein FOA43_000504 [Brettanomyces nanus]